MRNMNYTVYVVIARIVSAIVSFLLTIAITNGLDFDNSSHYFYFMNYAMMMGTLASLGLNNYLLKVYGVDNRDSLNVVQGISRAFFLSFFVFIIFSLITLFVFIDKTDLYGAIIVVVVSFSILFQLFTVAINQALRKPISSSFIETIIPYGVISVLLFFDLFVTWESVITALSFLIIIICLISLYSNGCLKLFLFNNIFNVNEQTLKLNDIKEFSIIMIIGLIVSYFPVQVGAVFVDLKEVSLIIVSIKLSMLLRVFFSAIVSISAPKMSEYYRNNKFNEFRKEVINSTRILTVVGVFGSITLYSLAPFIFDIYGDDYAGAYNYLIYILLAQAVFISTGVVGHALMMSDNSRALRNGLLINCVFCFPIALILAAKYGGVGISIGYGLLLSGQHIIASIILYKKTNINIFKAYRMAS